MCFVLYLCVCRSGGAWGDGGGGESDVEDYGEAMDDTALAYDDSAQGGGSNGYNGYAPIALDDAFTDAPTSYEDLCRKHIVRRKDTHHTHHTLPDI